MAKKHSVTAMSLKSQRVEISPNFRGNVCRFAVESPAISAASLQSSRMVERAVARKKGIHILSTFPCTAPSVKRNTNPRMPPTTMLPIKGRRLNRGVYKTRKGSTVISAIFWPKG